MFSGVTGEVHIIYHIEEILLHNIEYLKNLCKWWINFMEKKREKVERTKKEKRKKKKDKNIF